MQCEGWIHEVERAALQNNEHLVKLMMDHYALGCSLRSCATNMRMKCGWFSMAFSRLVVKSCKVNAKIVGQEPFRRRNSCGHRTTKLASLLLGEHALALRTWEQMGVEKGSKTS